MKNCSLKVKGDLAVKASLVVRKFGHVSCWKDKNLVHLILLWLFCWAFLPASFARENESQGDDLAAGLFSQKCSGCHTIGKGNLVGPDLQAVASWKSTEIEMNVKRMEKFVGPLKEEDIMALVDFLKDPKIKDRIESAQKRVSTAQVSELPSSADVGWQLFSGKESFTNGAPSCISCHQIEGHGGTMGKDLSDVFARMGESALISACEQPNFPVMKKVFSEHPLTKQEALHLTKYFASLKDSRKIQSDPPVTELGFLGAIALLGGIMVFYRNRNIGVRSRLKRR